MMIIEACYLIIISALTMQKTELTTFSLSKTDHRSGFNVDLLNLKTTRHGVKDIKYLMMGAEKKREVKMIKASLFKHRLKFQSIF